MGLVIGKVSNDLYIKEIVKAYEYKVEVIEKFSNVKKNINMGKDL